MNGVSVAGSAGYAVRPKYSTAVSSGARYTSSYADFIALFHRHLQQWKSETAFDSNLDAVTEHSSFRAIVGLQQRAVPLILDELRIGSSLLVYALEDITGERPYGGNIQGNIRAMTECWLLWSDRMGASCECVLPWL